MLSDPREVFLSYSYKDERLETHLGVLRGQLAVWNDRQLKACKDWVGKIAEAIETANVAVLLISADFLTSELSNQLRMGECAHG